MERVSDEIDGRIARLSGECSRVRYYTRNAARPAPAPGKPGRPSGPYPRRPLPRTPPNPAPKKPGLPFNPYTPPRKPFGKPPAVGAPLPKYPLGGLSAKGRRLLRTPLGIVVFGIIDVLNQPQGNQYPWDMVRAGYRLLKACQPVGGPTFIPGVAYSGKDTVFRGSAADPNLACTIVSQRYDNDFLGTLGPLPASQTAPWLSFGPDNQSIVGRMQIREQWLKLPGYPGAGIIPSNPTKSPVVVPYAPPYPYPAIDPFVLPPFAPEPLPNPIPFEVVPHRAPNPHSSPNEQPQKGPSPAPRPVPDNPAIPAPETNPGRRIPAREINLTPRGTPRPRPRPRPRPVPKPGVHVRRPPAPREREKKFVASRQAAGFIGGLIGLITESLDVLDSFFKALPPHVQAQYRWKDSNPWERAVFVAENLDQIRLGHLIANIIANALEDAAFGKVGKITAQMNKALWDNFGIDLQGRLPKSYLIPAPRV